MAELETEGFGIYFMPDFWEALDDNQKEQLRVYMEAFEVFNEREKKYHSLRMQYGAADSYHHMTSKVSRTQFLLEGVTDEEDDPIDLINYTAFFLRNLRAGRMTNLTERRKSEVIAIAQEAIGAGDQIVIDLETGKAVRFSA